MIDFVCTVKCLWNGIWKNPAGNGIILLFLIMTIVLNLSILLQISALFVVISSVSLVRVYSFRTLWELDFSLYLFFSFFVSVFQLIPCQSYLQKSRTWCDRRNRGIRTILRLKVLKKARLQKWSLPRFSIFILLENELIGKKKWAVFQSFCFWKKCKWNRD